ncbi:MAG: methyltransferase domain-containing protein [Xanthomonadales bacterium]|nr:methyltransferase domain-containing protein [Xanthomonadales bacterium]
MDDTVKPAAVLPSCCTTFYEQAWVRDLAEECFHPGGEALTRRTVEAMQLPSDAILADLGCGAGTSALLLAEHYGLQVLGLDRSVVNLRHAADKAQQHSYGQRVEWVQGRADSLPWSDASIDGVLAECTLSLFPDKPQVMNETLRVLKPGGVMAITDMCLEGALPDDLMQALAPWTCLSDTLSESAYRELFEHAGYRWLDGVDESHTLKELVATLKRRLLILAAASQLGPQAAGMNASALSDAGLDLAGIRHWLQRFEAAVDSGVIRYVRFHVQKPA